MVFDIVLVLIMPARYDCPECGYYSDVNQWCKDCGAKMDGEDNMNKWADFFREIIDNDTLIILGLIAIMVLSPDNRELIAGGLLGVIGMKAKNKVQ